MSEPRAPFIPDEILREIRETCSIVDVISDFVTLKKTGRTYKGLCPFHNEKTPSFVVNEEKKFFHCFGCGASGDVFAFLMKHEQVGFQEAARTLAGRMGIQLPQRRLSPQEQHRQNERENFFRINEQAASFYNRLLMEDSRAAGARNYLLQRGLTQETIERYGLGYAPPGWAALVHQLQRSRDSLDSALRLGLLGSKTPGRYYDRFRDRIMFPIVNVSDHVIGFGGRVTATGEPKYLNSPESAIYSKRHSLFGLQAAKQAIRTEDCAVIVEGYFDALTLHQAGVVNVVAALGTALTEQQIQILRRYSANIVLVFDADPAGQKAMKRSLEPFLRLGIPARLVLLPAGDDPDSFVRQHGPEAFREELKKAGLLLDYVIETIIEAHQVATPRGKIAACDEALPVIAGLPDALERKLYLQRLAQRLGLSVPDVTARLRPGAAVRTQGTPPAADTSSAPADHAEKMIIKLMVAHPDTIEHIDRDGLIGEFSDPDLRQAGAILLSAYRKCGTPDIAAVLQEAPSEQVRSALAQAAFTDDLPDSPYKCLEDCIRHIRLKQIGRNLEQASLRLKQAEAARDSALSRQCLQEHQRLLQERQNVLRFKLNV